MTTLEVIVGATRDLTSGVTGGLSYNLSSKVDYIHVGNDGFGITEFERYMESGPLQDGAIDIGYSLRPRKVQLILNMVASNQTEYWALRSQLMYIFAPRTNPIYLKFTNPARTYYLECYTEGGLTMASTDKQGNVGHKVAVQLVAPDTLFFSTPVITTLLSGASTDVTTIVSYAGNYKSNPVFSLTGPITNPVIRLLDGAIVISTITTTLSIASLSTVALDLRYGKKICYNAGTLANLMQYVSEDSDLSMIVSPPPDRSEVKFRITGSGTTSSTSIKVLVEPKFVGI